MPERRITAWFCWTICIAVLLAHGAVVMANFSTLLREARAVSSTFPLPHYGFLPVPHGQIPAGEHGRLAFSLGADFSQVYQSGRAIRHGQSAYEPVGQEWRDYFGRRPNYPPLINHLYLPLAALSFPDAVWLHTLATLALFLGLSAWVLWELGLTRLILPFATTSILLGHLTPIGFTHFERGQFDFLVASAFLLASACLIVRRRMLLMSVGSGLLAGLKWTSFPFLGCFVLVAWLVSPSRKQRLVLLAIPCTIMLGLVLFPSELMEYLPGVWVYEVLDKPSVFSLAQILPPWLAKSVVVIFACSFLGALFARVRKGLEREQALAASGPPFALAIGIQSMLFGTWAFEYRVVALLGLVPFVLHWVESASIVPLRVRGAVAAGLALFLLIAFRVFEIRGGFADSTMRDIYLVASLAFLAGAVRVLMLLPRPSQ